MLVIRTSLRSVVSIAVFLHKEPGRIRWEKLWFSTDLMNPVSHCINAKDFVTEQKVISASIVENLVLTCIFERVTRVPDKKQRKHKHGSKGAKNHERH